MPFWLLLFIMACVTYRVSRFIILDGMIAGTRTKVVNWLDFRAHKLIYRKLAELLECPYCVTIWVSAGTVLITSVYVDIPLPVWVWLAVGTGALMIWSFVDNDEK
jgi:hypothetical protein